MSRPPGVGVRGRAEKNPQPMTGGLGVGYSSLLFASKATFVARVSPGSAPKSCRFVFGIGCLSASCFLLVEDSGTCCHREILIQNLAAAFASSVASRCVPARYVTNSSCCRRHFVVNWLALSDAGQRIGLPQLLGQGRLLLVEKSFVRFERRSVASWKACQGRFRVACFLPSSQKRRGGQAPSSLHTHIPITQHHPRFSILTRTPVRSALAFKLYSPGLPLLPTARCQPLRCCWVGASRLSTSRRRNTPPRSTTCT